MTRVRLDGYELRKVWQGRVLQEIKDHVPVEVWDRDVRHHDSDLEVLVYHPIVEFPTAAEKANYTKQWQPGACGYHALVRPDPAPALRLLPCPTRCALERWAAS